jgi:aconitate hydratase
MANLINSGIIPMTFENEGDYDEIDMGDEIVIENIIEQIKSGNRLIVKNKTKNKDIPVNVSLSERQVEIILTGGLINYTKKQNK